LIGNDAGTLANNYKLEADLDLMNIEWTPIGKYSTDLSKAFKGNFDGDNHQIFNLKISVSTFSYTSLLGVASGAETNFIKNIILKTGEISVGANISAASVVNKMNGYTIENCMNHISITGSGNVAGIGTGAGTGGKYKNCHNYGHLKGQVAVGISGHSGTLFTNSYSELTDCINHGKIEGVSVAGISLEGIAINCTNKGEIKGNTIAAGIVISGSAKNCTNEGKVDSENYAAGIVHRSGYTGGHIQQSNAENCINKGDVTGNEFAGGILSLSGDYGSASVSGCKNLGAVHGKIAGGVGGDGSSSSRMTIQDCSNEGNIYGQNVGGITGGRAYFANGRDNRSEISINNSINKANVQGTGEYVGGIASYGVVSGSTNFGIVKGEGKYTGGIVGDGSVNNSENKGEVYGKGDYTGGVAGIGSVVECTNIGRIFGYGKYTAGIVTGEYPRNGSAQKSINHGEVYGTGDYTGGIVAGHSDSVENCENRGNIHGLGKYTGGILSFGSSKKNTNFGVVKGEGEYTGGIIGAGSAEDCINKGEVYGSVYTGGITGYGSAVRCSNHSSVKGGSQENSSTGGIAGYNLPLSPDNNFVLSNYAAVISSFNTGAVSANKYVGGIVGKGGRVYGCYNSGTVSGSTVVGGISGGESFITSSYNKGAVKGVSMLGGIAGIDSYIFGCYNIGEIGYGGYMGIGPVIGTVSGKYLLLNNYWGENESRPNTNERFSATQWPKATYLSGISLYVPNEGTKFIELKLNLWAIGSGKVTQGYNEGYWKSIGSWNNGNPVYPKLHFED